MLLFYVSCIPILIKVIDYILGLNQLGNYSLQDCHDPVLVLKLRPLVVLLPQRLFFFLNNFFGQYQICFQKQRVISRHLLSGIIMYYNVFLPKECQFCVVKNTKVELKIYYTSKIIESCKYSKTTNFATDQSKFINRN